MPVRAVTRYGLLTAAGRLPQWTFPPPGWTRAAGLAGARGLAIGWVHADLRDYRPGEGAFQLVLIAYLQLREAELDGVLRRAAAALAPAGVLLVVGHDVTNLTEGRAARRIRLSCTRRNPSRAPSAGSPWSGRTSPAPGRHRPGGGYPGPRRPGLITSRYLQARSRTPLHDS